MRWHVEYSKRAVKALRKMDRFDRTMVLEWIDRNLEGCENPRAHGKSLTGSYGGMWRYRVGKYRILCRIENEALVVYALEIGHRREVYQS